MAEARPSSSRRSNAVLPDRARSRPRHRRPTAARPRSAPGRRSSPRPALEADEEEAPRTARRGAPARPAAAPKPARSGGEKRRGRLTVVTAFSAGEERERSEAAFRRRVLRKTGHRDAEPKEKIAREVTIPETITIQELANRMAERSVDVVRILMQQGHMANITDTIDADTAQL